MNMEKIEGKVAKILDEYSIVINIGRDNDVVNGMVFVVFVQSDDEVKIRIAAKPWENWNTSRIISLYLMSRINFPPVLPERKRRRPEKLSLRVLRHSAGL